MNIDQLKIALSFFKIAIITSIGIMVTSCTMLHLPKTTAKQHTNRTETLSIHNKLRSQHHAPNLAWDDTLASYAERHASKCQFRHSGSPYGENLAAGYPSISAAVNAWYAERKQYNANQPGFSHRTGHFTQLVWKASTAVGCGYATCNGKNGTPGKYWVCEYSPAGNVVNRGYFKANVM